MDLKIPQKIFIKIHSYKNMESPIVATYPIERDGLKIVQTDRNLDLKINEKNRVSMIIHYNAKWICLEIDGTKSLPVVARKNSKKKTTSIDFNENFSRECLEVVRKKMEKAVEQYFKGKEDIVLILDINKIVSETLTSLKNKKMEYEKASESYTTKEVFTLKDLERYFEKRKKSVKIEKKQNILDKTNSRLIDVNKALIEQISKKLK